MFECRGKILHHHLPFVGGQDCQTDVCVLYGGLHLPAGVSGLRLRQKAQSKAGVPQTDRADSRGDRAEQPKQKCKTAGLGKIGEEALRRVVTHPALQGRPFILETPNEDDGYAREIAMVRKWQEQ